MTSVFAGRPNDDHELVVQQTISLKALLAIVLAVIKHRQLGAREHDRRIGEIQPSCFERRLPLGLMEGDFHA